MPYTVGSRQPTMSSNAHAFALDAVVKRATAKPLPQQQQAPARRQTGRAQRTAAPQSDKRGSSSGGGSRNKANYNRKQSSSGTHSTAGKRIPASTAAGLLRTRSTGSSSSSKGANGHDHRRSKSSHHQQQQQQENASNTATMHKAFITSKYVHPVFDVFHVLTESEAMTVAAAVKHGRYGLHAISAAKAAVEEEEGGGKGNGDHAATAIVNTTSQQESEDVTAGVRKEDAIDVKNDHKAAALAGVATMTVAADEESSMAHQGKPPRRKEQTEAEAFALILHSNGIPSHADLHTVAAISIFQQGGYRRMIALSRFTGLVRLEIMCQGLTEIEGLQACTNIEALFLQSNEIKRISGLSACTQLRELHLGDNRISRIENIDHLHKLEILSLFDNVIHDIEGVRNMSSALRNLNLARNRIKVIGNVFDKLGGLTELNLANNLIDSFNQIRNLAQLKGLKILYFTDPHFGANPVCSLCNYHTYALYHLQHLEELDSIRLTEEAAQLAEATYLKKKIYYNMRIKMGKRNTSNIVKYVEGICKTRIAEYDDQASGLMKELRGIEKVLDTQLWSKRQHENRIEMTMLAAAGGDKPDKKKPKTDMASGFDGNALETTSSAGDGDRGNRNEEVADGADAVVANHALYLNKKRHTEKALHTIRTRIAAIDDLFREWCEYIKQSSERMLLHLVAELETGGNIRFEDGTSAEPWFGSCAQFVRSRCDTAAFRRMYGIVGVHVRSVTKVHNRVLRNNFENRLESIPQFDPTNVNRKRPELQYLFLVNNHDGDPEEDIFPVSVDKHRRALCGSSSTRKPSSSKDANDTSESAPDTATSRGSGFRNDIYQFAEFGFPDANELVARGLEGAVVLSNSVSHIDNARVQRMSKKPRYFSKSRVSGGVLLICKVYVGHAVPKKANSDSCVDPADYPSADSVVDALSPLDTSTASNGVDKVAADKQAQVPVSAKQQRIIHHRNVFVFDSCMVLPEYIVTYDYVRKPFSNLFNGGGLAMSSSSASGKVGDLVDGDMSFVAAPLLKAMGGFIALRDPIVDFHIHWSQCKPIEVATGVLKMQPELPKWQKHDSVTSLVPKGGRSKQALLYFNMHDHRLSSISGLIDLVKLRVLVLTFNNIRSIEGLNALVCLERLELGWNAIEDVPAGTFSGLKVLTALDLSYNLLTSLNVASVLKNEVPQLERLSLEGNRSITGRRVYRPLMIMSFPGLQLLDGEAVLLSERLQNKSDPDSWLMRPATIAPDLVLEGGYVDRDVALATLRKAESCGDGASPSCVSAVAIDGLLVSARSPVYTRVRAKDVLSESRRRTVGEDWQKLVVELELDQRQIVRMENLDLLTHVRKLNLADNDISRIEGLDELHELKELCLEGNRINKIENILHLRQLVKLELGRNDIETIEGLELDSYHDDQPPNPSTCLLLSQVSLENNSISCLGGLRSLYFLMELYLANNAIEDKSEVMQLRELPKLLILDLSGNPVCKEKNYRMFTIFHLKQLRVLDGIGIETSDQVAAQTAYTGRLTDTMLRRAVGANKCATLRQLKLGNRRLRTIAGVTADVFCALRILNLDNNQLTDVTSLAPLPKLEALYLNHNRISEIPREALTATGGAGSSTPASGGRCFLAACFPKLEVLQLGHNRIGSISMLHLRGLTNLQVLMLNDNDLTRIDGLSSLHALKQLVLCKNQIKRIEPRSFAHLSELQQLQLEENGLRSLTNLGPLPKLQRLFLAYNRIADVADLSKLTPAKGFGKLSELTLCHNPVARKSMYRATLIWKIPELEVLDAISVSPEERQQTTAWFNGDTSGSVSMQAEGCGVGGGGSNGAVHSSDGDTSSHREVDGASGNGGDDVHATVGADGHLRQVPAASIATTDAVAACFLKGKNAMAVNGVSSLRVQKFGLSGLTRDNSAYMQYALQSGNQAGYGGYALGLSGAGNAMAMPVLTAGGKHGSAALLPSSTAKTLGGAAGSATLPVSSIGSLNPSTSSNAMASSSTPAMAIAKGMRGFSVRGSGLGSFSRRGTSGGAGVGLRSSAPRSAKETRRSLGGGGGTRGRVHHSVYNFPL